MCPLGTKPPLTREVAQGPRCSVSTYPHRCLPIRLGCATSSIVSTSHCIARAPLCAGEGKCYGHHLPIHFTPLARPGLKGSGQLALRQPHDGWWEEPGAMLRQSERTALEEGEGRGPQHLPAPRGQAWRTAAKRCRGWELPSARSESSRGTT